MTVFPSRTSRVSTSGFQTPSKTRIIPKTMTTVEGVLMSRIAPDGKLVPEFVFQPHLATEVR
jgi:hypothetical protein